MFHHCVQNRIVADGRVVKTKLSRQRFLVAQALPRGDPGAFIQPLQLFAARRGLQIFDNNNVGAFIFQILGYLWIRKILDIEF